MDTRNSAIERFKERLDTLWNGISTSCATCVDPDCMGYLWLLGDDAGEIMRAGYGIVRINPPDGPRFIDSYVRDSEGALTVQARSPACPYLDSARRCAIHDHRPLVCRLYPLSLETLPDGTVAWLLHTNCNHIRRVQAASGLDNLVREIHSALGSMAPSLLDELKTVYGQVNAVTERMSIEDTRHVLVISKLDWGEPIGGETT